MVADIVKPANRKQTKTVNASATTTQYVYPDAGKDLTKVTVNGLTVSAALGNATTDDVAEGKTFSSSNGILLTGTGAIIPNAHVYGAEWAGGSIITWTRTDESANFSNPNPYYSGMSTTPSSPFDGLMPWAGMRRVSDTNAGELVEIPKFWYKWTRDGAKMKLQIADNYKPGFYTSPAHADRGDGVGERDYVYVGRYHCASDYLSKTNVLPKVNINRPTARTGIRGLRSDIYQYDLALHWTICMLYLVEFAHWNSQDKIGYGNGNGSSRENTGSSDTMPYHTGTIRVNRTTYGTGVQYRYIENLWANVRNWCDGIYFNYTSAYCIKNPNNYGTTTSSTFIGNLILTDTSYITAFSNPSAIAGFEYALLPSSVNGTSSTYICDGTYSLDNEYKTGAYPYVGGMYSQGQIGGLFCFVTDGSDDITDRDNIGCRLQVLPSSRLN